MILVGTVKDLPKKVTAWAQADFNPELLLPDYVLARGRSYLDWIGPAVIRHPSAGVLRERRDYPGRRAHACWGRSIAMDIFDRDAGILGAGHDRH